MKASDYEPAQFLNVDLDIKSRVSLEPLIKEVEHRTIVLHHAKSGKYWFAVLEVVLPRNADRAIRAFVRLVKGLSPAARALWDGALVRTFNVGIQAGLQPAAFEQRVEAKSVREAAALGADIVVTVYSPSKLPRHERRRGNAG